jgi:hypothetical protein
MVVGVKMLQEAAGGGAFIRLLFSSLLAVSCWVWGASKTTLFSFTSILSSCSVISRYSLTLRFLWNRGILPYAGGHAYRISVRAEAHECVGVRE